MPDLSILVPTYNRSEYLKECLESLLSTTTDCEIVVSDNASTDDTPSLVESFSDPRIRYIRHETNLGAVKNYNFLLSEARGDFVCLFGDDDLAIPGCFEIKVSLLKDYPDIAMVYSLWERIDENGKVHGTLKWPGLLNHSYLRGRDEFGDLIVASYLTWQALVFRRSLYDEHGGVDEGIIAGIDWDLLLRYCRGNEVAFIHQPTVKVRFHDKSYTDSASQTGQFAEDRIAIWRKWLIDHDSPPVISDATWRRMAAAFEPDLRHEFGQNDQKVQEYMKKLVLLNQEYVRSMERRMQNAVTKTTDLNENPGNWTAIYEKVNLDQVPQHYHAFTKMPFLSEYLERAALLCPEGGRALETGIGFGYGAIWLSRRGVQAEGIDYSEDIVERAKSINEALDGQATFRFGDFFNLAEHIDGTYDVILHQGVLEHFSDDEIREILRQQVRISQYVIFSVPSIHYPFEREFGNERLLTLHKWKTILEDFDIEFLTYYGDPGLGANEHVMGVLRGSIAGEKRTPPHTTVSQASARLDAPIDQSQTPTKLIWSSPLLDPNGYADEARNFLVGLERVGVDVKVNPVQWSEKRVQLSEEDLQIFQRQAQRPVESGFIHVQHTFPKFFERVPQASYEIGRTMFETDRIPADWVAKCNQMDELWVPSEFNIETFSWSGVERSKLFKLPGAIEPKNYGNHIEPYRLQSQHGFHFLSLFDWQLRKGWDVLLRAFVEEFGLDEDVCLIIKTYSSAGLTEEQILGQIESYLANNLGRDLEKTPDISVLHEHLSQHEMAQLYQAVDAYVMPSRGEGWGRPYMEAMVSGLPVIGTGWSGNTEFMNAENSYLIEHKVEDVSDASVAEASVFAGHRWAEPSVEHLRSLMRYVFDNRDAAQERGRFARKYVADNYSREQVGRIIKERLEAIQSQATSA